MIIQLDIIYYGIYQSQSLNHPSHDFAPLPFMPLVTLRHRRYIQNEQVISERMHVKVK